VDASIYLLDLTTASIGSGTHPVEKAHFETSLGGLGTISTVNIRWEGQVIGECKVTPLESPSDARRKASKGSIPKT
jgi:hypothetical protein